MELQAIDVTKIIVAFIAIIPQLLAPVLERVVRPSKIKKGPGGIPLPAPGPAPSFISRQTYFLTLGVVIVADLALILGPMLSGTELNISTPQNDVKVANCFFVGGTHQRIPNNKIPWLIVQASTTDRFYPQKRIFLAADEDWTSSVCVGEDAERYAVVAVLVPEATDKEFYGYIVAAEQSGQYQGFRYNEETVDRFSIEEFSRVFVIKE